MESDNINSNEKSLDFVSIIKFSLISLICSLVLGLIFYNLTQFSVFQYGIFATTGLTILAFPFGVLISVGIFSTFMDNKMNAIIMGLIVAVLVSFLQQGFITFAMGRMMGGWFDTYIGNQIVLLVIFGLIGAYIGNTYLKNKIHI